MARELDVVLHGATGFVGRLTAQHLAEHGHGARIGLSGRSRARLEQVRDELGPSAAGWPLLVTESHDVGSVRELAASTTVVVSTVGPYAVHGMPLVEACAEASTHYADLTGEVLFVRRSIDAAHERAQASGARIVHACGFDAVPSDLSVLLLHEAAGRLGETTLAVEALKGGVSGGTLASIRGQLEEVRRDSAARRLMLDPYALSPDRSAEPAGGRERDGWLPGRVEDVGWTAPFVMAPFNTRVVRRSNAVLGWDYGRDFRYREVVATGKGPRGPVTGLAMTAGLGALAAGLALPPTRALLDRLLPGAGDGPSERTRREGHFRVRTRTRTPDGRRWVATVAAQGDPGYAATAVMLGESALALAQPDGLPDRAGVLTPATGIGVALVERLRDRGFTLEVSSGEPVKGTG
jgi:short subunit dehydrogenase-like uncharacterized protein